MLGFGSKKPAAKVNHVDVFDRALADATSAARKAGIGPGTLMSRFEASAESLRMSAHHESERRMMSTNTEAINEKWFQAEKRRLIKAGEWPK